MSKTSELIIAGFGGQGILFAGKVLAYGGLMCEKEVSWLPSYGPEMRGGTANCHVIISDMPIGAPIITEPNLLIAMNKPSLDKFENAVVSGGTIIIDSSLIDRKVERDDVNVFYIPATQMALDMDAAKMANMIILGKLIKETDIMTYDELKAGLKKCVPQSKAELLDFNLKVIDAGYHY